MTFSLSLYFQIFLGKTATKAGLMFFWTLGPFGSPTPLHVLGRFHHCGEKEEEEDTFFELCVCVTTTTVNTLFLLCVLSIWFDLVHL